MLKSAYVQGMRALRRPLRATGVLDALQSQPKKTLGFWLGSQFAIYDATELMRLDVPWWTFAAIDRVEGWIAARNGQVRALEYGAGASTIWLARRCAHVTSVEHDEGFHALIRPQLQHDNVVLKLLKPAPSAGSCRAPSGRRGYEDLDFSEYVAAVDTDRFDLIIIDGRARVSCLERARHQLAPGGLIVFDNSERRRYRAALRDPDLRIERCRGWAPALPYRSETSLITPRSAHG